ncbi:MAG TPA: GTPase HflX [Anaerolineae bacterium]|nr:GTPase HflX [Anaerolineae bacterium]
MSKISLPTELPRERAFLVGVELQTEPGLLAMSDSLSELALLADTAGLVVVGQTSQRLQRPNPKTYIGSGKVQEVRKLAEEAMADVILFDVELSPRHQRELERIFEAGKRLGEGMRVIDRTALILDIFAQHAHTREGSLQVELAQLEYRLPRLTRAWTHLARQAGGGGGRAGRSGGVGLRGPGETQIEVDRREIGRRIAHLREELEKVRAHRSRYRTRRQRADIPTVALVGYTNAGKSTLLNRLSGSDVLVADQLFATLDPTTRRVELPEGQAVLITDTVGFIQKLPTTLVAAFRATLEEIVEANLLLHVVDVNHPNALQQAEAVRTTLAEIDGMGIPVVTALNKIDLLDGSQRVDEIEYEFDSAVRISATKGEGIPELMTVLERELYEAMVQIEVFLPYSAMALQSLMHAEGSVEFTEHKQDGVLIRGRIPKQLVAKFRKYRMPKHAAVLPPDADLDGPAPDVQQDPA